MAIAPKNEPILKEGRGIAARVNIKTARSLYERTVQMRQGSGPFPCLFSGQPATSLRLNTIQDSSRNTA